MVPPITTSTVTSNVTAIPPNDLQQHKKDKSPAPPTDQRTSSASVSQMQQQIQRSLSSSPKPSLPTRLAQSLQKHAPSTTRTYTIYGETEALFKSCDAQADYAIPTEQRMNVLTGKGPPKTADQAELGHPVRESWWFDTIGLPPTFSTWSQVTFLHMYVLMVRLRALDTAAEVQNYHRYLIEHFSRAAEDKMVIQHNLAAQSIRSKYLKDLFLQWRGILASYDEGLVKGDAVLASALWRNLFRGQEDVDWEKVACVVAFLRKAVAQAGRYNDVHELIAGKDGESGLWASSRRRVQEIVEKPSEEVKQPFLE